MLVLTWIEAADPIVFIRVGRCADKVLNLKVRIDVDNGVFIPKSHDPVVPRRTENGRYYSVDYREERRRLGSIVVQRT